MKQSLQGVNTGIRQPSWGGITRLEERMSCGAKRSCRRGRRVTPGGPGRHRPEVRQREHEPAIVSKHALHEGASTRSALSQPCPHPRSRTSSPRRSVPTEFHSAHDRFRELRRSHAANGRAFYGRTAAAASTRFTAQTMRSGSSLGMACVLRLDTTTVPFDEASAHSCSIRMRWRRSA
jgi:hypothetical protein